jgi:hypothetical protein
MILEVQSRPICNVETPARCRKTAVVSLDGVWVCQGHLDNPTPALAMLVRDSERGWGVKRTPIVWRKRVGL